VPEASSKNNLVGVWCFAFPNQDSLASAPPMFDVFELGEEASLKLKSTFQGFDFSGTYATNGTKLDLTFHATNRVEPQILALKAVLINDGQALLLSSRDGSDSREEMVYFRSNRFLFSDIAGKWTVNEGGTTQTMTLGTNGDYRLTDGDVNGYYRLWRSAKGIIMTTAFFVHGEGGFTLLQRCERKGAELHLTPVTHEGRPLGPATIWTLSK
jgi:hypothetical protein